MLMARMTMARSAAEPSTLVATMRSIVLPARPHFAASDSSENVAVAKQVLAFIESKPATSVPGAFSVTILSESRAAFFVPIARAFAIPWLSRGWAYCAHQAQTYGCHCTKRLHDRYPPGREIETPGGKTPCEEYWFNHPNRLLSRVEVSEILNSCFVRTSQGSAPCSRSAAAPGYTYRPFLEPPSVSNET
jgi:hypothetical protein